MTMGVGWVGIVSPTKIIDNEDFNWQGGQEACYHLDIYFNFGTIGDFNNHKALLKWYYAQFLLQKVFKIQCIY